MPTKIRRHSTRARATYYRLSKDWGKESRSLDQIEDALKEQATETLEGVLRRCFRHLDAMSIPVPFVIQQEIDKRIRNEVLKTPVG